MPFNFIYVVKLIAISVVVFLMVYFLVKSYVGKKRKIFDLAVSLYESGKYEKSIYIAEKLINTAFKPLAFNLIADCYLRLEKYEMAIKYYDLSISEEEENPLNYMGLAEVYLLYGDYVSAISQMNKATSFGYKNSNLMILLAMANYLNGNKSNFYDLIEELSKASDLDYYLKRNWHINKDKNFDKKDHIEKLIIDFAESGNFGFLKKD
jgi:tetratricopeptide (TPR) repeat protein